MGMGMVKGNGSTDIGCLIRYWSSMFCIGLNICENHRLGEDSIGYRKHGWNNMASVRCTLGGEMGMEMGMVKLVIR